MVAGSTVGEVPRAGRSDTGRTLPASAASCPSGLTLSVTPSIGPIPLLVNFTLTETGAGAGSISWEFGDGSGWNSSVRPLTTVLHVYYAPGTFPVNVSVPESSGPGVCRASVTATAPPLQIAIRAAPVTGPAPLTVDFTANVTGGTGTYRSLLWTFGDGENGSGFGVDETFPDSGNFFVTATVVDSSGASAAAEANLTVTAGPSGPSGGSSNGGPSATVVEIGAGLIVLLLAVVAVVWYVRSRPASPAGSPTPSFETAPESPPSEGLLAEAATPGPGTPTTPPPRERQRRPRPTSGPVLTLSQQILLHLATLGPIEAHEVTPRGYTQLGLAEALGARQGFVSNVLVRMVAAGLLAHELRHVPGFSRRVKVYRLTPIGQSMSRQLRSAPAGNLAGTSPAPKERRAAGSTESDG